LIIVVSILLFSLVVINVLFRYIIKQPISWANELAIYAFVWWVFLGSALAVKKNRHIFISFLKDRIPASVRSIVNKFISILMIIYCSVATYLSLQLIPLVFKQKVSIMGFSISYVYVIIPFSSILMVIYTVLLLFTKDKDIN